MGIMPITVFGDKILRKKTEPLKDIDFQTIKEIKDMFETMRNANGVGLAANQVGLDKSIFVIDISPVEGYEKIKPIVMINPKIKSFSDEKVNIEEGCLSIPNLRAEVLRPAAIQVEYWDTDMKSNILEADEFFARVIQHEFDHLQGTVFTDKVTDAIKKQLKKDLEKIRLRKFEADYPIADK